MEEALAAGEAPVPWKQALGLLGVMAGVEPGASATARAERTT